MTRIDPIDPTRATGKAQQLLTGVQSKFGMVPNQLATMANSPAVLDAYLKFSSTLGAGELSNKTREQIALAVGQANGCNYCLSAHSALGKMVGLTVEQVRDARRATADDAKSAAILTFASQIVEKRGRVSDQDIAVLRDAGVSEAEITEVVANTALNMFTNYFSHVADSDIDFPLAEQLEGEPQGESCGCQKDSCSVA